ncbi:MAG TPA: hypothetical protein VK791_04210 [bacterium]|nr:hypothetical protein [bacterium]
MSFKNALTLLALLLFAGAPSWGRELTFAEKTYQKILDAQSIQNVTCADICGLGKQDALVVYSKPATDENATIIGGVAVFDHDKGLLWKHESSCYNFNAEPIVFDKDNPKVPFIRVTPCHNASIGCGMELYRWVGTRFQLIYTDGSGNERKLMTMPDGNPVMQTAWRGRGVPNLIRFEKGEVVDCSRAYPAFYQSYIDKAYETLAAEKWPDLEPMVVQQNFLPAFIYAGKYQEGLDFCEKLRPLMVKQDQLREDKISQQTSNSGPKGPDHLFMKELDGVIAAYQEMEKNGGSPNGKKYKKKKAAPASAS